MRILFLIQGEGRGHLTQAISLAQIVQMGGHEVVGALVGVTNNRAVPAFFSEQFTAPIFPLQSPGLVYNTRTNALEPVKTTWKALLNARTYWQSCRQVREAIASLRPDVVVNFYELLGGLTYVFHRPSVPMIALSHQYLSFHPDFPFPPGKRLDRLVFKINSRLTAWGAHELLALSFDEQPDVPGQRLRVVPPLLRQEVTQLKPTTGSYMLAYTTQAGLVPQIIEAHRQRPDVPLRCFHGGVKVVEEVVDSTLTFHAIDGQRFLEAMQHCRAVVSTAGFESVCEALYLGKPVLMIPQPNHFEQSCNALDGERAGVGVAATTFDLNRLVNYLPNYDIAASERFRQWYNRGYYLFLAALNRAQSSNTNKKGRSYWPRLTRWQRRLRIDL